MQRFALLLDRLAYEVGRNNKLRLITEYFRTVPDPDRGFALAALTGVLSFRHAKAGVIRALAEKSAWASQHENIFVLGPTGVGKSFVAGLQEHPPVLPCERRFP